MLALGFCSDVSTTWGGRWPLPVAKMLHHFIIRTIASQLYFHPLWHLHHHCPGLIIFSLNYICQSNAFFAIPSSSLPPCIWWSTNICMLQLEKNSCMFSLCHLHQQLTYYDRWKEEGEKLVQVRMQFVLINAMLLNGICKVEPNWRDTESRDKKDLFVNSSRIRLEILFSRFRSSSVPQD